MFNSEEMTYICGAAPMSQARLAQCLLGNEAFAHHLTRWNPAISFDAEWASQEAQQIKYHIPAKLGHVGIY